MFPSPLPRTMKAITINGNIAQVSSIPLPTLRPTYLLAKVDSIALNPTDWKHISRKIAAANGVSGCDFSGTVVEVGADVSKAFKPGDRIAGTTHGANASRREDGCFAEFCVAKADLVVRIPDGLGFEAAATFPLGVGTVGQGLFQKALRLPLPSPDATPFASTSAEDKAVLIYGGSTATGSLGIQFARLAGYRVLTTCSPHNFDFVRGLGAEEVFDYNSPDCGEQINAATKDGLKLAWDTVSVASSASICAAALSSDGKDARYGSILPQAFPRQEVESTSTFMYTIFNEAFVKGGRETPAVPEDFEFAKRMFGLTEGLLNGGKLRTHPELVGERGLEGALEGMREMKEGRVSGRKLVYRVRETPEGSKARVEL